MPTINNNSRDLLQSLYQVDKDHLLTAIHDLRGFIQVVLSNAEMLEQLADSEFGEKTPRDPIFRQAACSILESARGAGELIHGLFSPEPVELQNCELQEVLDRLLAITEGWEVAIRIPPSIPELSLGLRRDALLRVLLNLLKNSLETGCPSPCWTLEITELGDNMIKLRASDNGPGISAAQLQHIFNPGSSNKGSGRGWGLFGSRVLLRAAGGDLRGFASEQGQGASFELEIPRALSADSAF